MNRTSNYVLYLTRVTVLALAILIFPYLYFQYQERKLLSETKEMDMNVFQMDKIENNTLTLEEKMKLLTDGNANLKLIELKTGDRYSLYEARRQCFRELSKIPVLEITIYGPILREIDITPYLLIDSETPSYSMLIWKGSLTIKDIEYQITMEEESGKILFVQPVGEKNEILDMQWEKYLKNP